MKLACTVTPITDLQLSTNAGSTTIYFNLFRQLNRIENHRPMHKRKRNNSIQIKQKYDPSIRDGGVLSALAKLMNKQAQH